ncbi:hypothetical protein HZH68_015566 [Vespula germanica]|uniref:Uncharacterized protein n=1 Tax=Vespula germanica TaxID=30212 RepID=A0A834MST6_VESGE|nr:hypothetical protein HZH68_015566 [Vespula germanica]
MRESILIGFHAIACLQFAYSVYYDYTYTVVPQNVMKVHGAFGGRFKFLTFWDADARNLFHERHLGVSSDGSTDATSANSILCRFIGIRIDTLFCWRNAEQPRLG